MIKIGITGQNGFIGNHILQTVKLYPKKFQPVQFGRGFFENPGKMDAFVKECDVIVHLAALNRHNDPNEIYKTNIELTNNLIDSLKRTEVTPHILISSSTQEERDNLYGKSKKEAREILASWADEAGALFSGLIIPNVYGPFGQPNYNSVVATFCHQVAHNEKPIVEVDGDLKLIYVGELIEKILSCIREKSNAKQIQVKHTAESKVSDLLKKLNYYKEVYQDNGEIPKIDSVFEHNLFNTFRCYMPKEKYFPRSFKKHEDNRGYFVELMRSGISGQTSFSTTKPGITRGEHFHTRKIERFAIIQGKARIQLRRIGTEDILNFELDGTVPSYVDMPIWYTHNMTNIGQEDLITVFWINEPYNAADSDTWFEKV